MIWQFIENDGMKDRTI